jgi:tRNA threonylcarbamoyladenosine biosynthesis protein TsaB
VIAEVLLDSPDGFAHVLFGRIEEMLARHGWPLKEVDCFASASGPGSFTGVRVSLTAVKGLAEALGKPVVGVSNLRALAWFGSAEVRAPFLDARRGEVYGGLYDSGLHPLGEERVIPFADWLAVLPRSLLELVTFDFQPFAAELAETPFGSMPRVTAPRALAPAIARIALEEFEAGRAMDPAALDANYVRRSDAELNWKDG